MSAWQDFHFLRPLWLAALLPAVWLWWQLRRDSSEGRAWRDLIAPHLLGQLMVGGRQARGRVRPVHLLGAFWLLGVLALAGPAWQREPAPFAEDRAALMIALQVTPSMLAQDIQPSRLERSVQKIHDLLERRKGAHAGLVAFAGSAHRVTPLTHDASVLETFAAELSPDLMPLEGLAPEAAVRLANRELADSGLSGSILLVADDVPADRWEDLQQQRAAGGAEVLVYAAAGGPEIAAPAGSPPAPALDLASMRAAGRAAGGGLTLMTVDDADVDELAGRVEQSLSRAAAEEGDRWRDAGVLALTPLALIALWSFRRGWRIGAS